MEGTSEDHREGEPDEADDWVDALLSVGWKLADAEDFCIQPFDKPLSEGALTKLYIMCAFFGLAVRVPTFCSKLFIH